MEELKVTEEMIKGALENNVELSKEEYEKTFADAKKNASGKEKKYGGEPVSEATKHKRIQSNFYGCSVNYLSAILYELQKLNDFFERASQGEEEK